MTASATSHDWLKDTTRQDQQVLALLEAENSATDAALRPLAGLQADLLAEFDARARIDRRSPEVIDGDYAYYVEFDADAAQPRHMRRHLPTGSIETLLDEDLIAAGGFCDFGDITISDDHTRIAWTEDREGDEHYTIYVKDITTSAILATVTGTAAPVLFNTDGTQIVYLTHDDAHRPYRAWAYNIPTGATTLLHEETDERYLLDLSATRDEQWIVISAESSQTTSEHVIVDRRTLEKPTLFTPRVEGTYTSIDAFAGHFWAISNHRRLDNELFIAQVGKPATQWQAIFTPPNGANLESIELFTNHIAFDLRYQGFSRVAICHRNGTALGPLAWLESIDDASTTSISSNPMPASPYLTIETSNWVTPDQTVRYTLEDNATTPVSARTVIHTEPVPGYNADQYTAELRWTTSHDGTRIPYSVITRRNTTIIGTQLWAYGAYGVNEDPGLVDTWISLLDRGIACAVAYPRGGGELGRHWYDNGKLEHKANTFYDMLAVSRTLNADGYGPLALRGGSAGGLMVGATINLSPTDFAVAIAEVPFVDVLATMLDPTLPLTIGEYEEWGNPEDPEVYERIRQYSPIDNIATAHYPAVLATAGLHDPRVGYWEPAKWVMRLREHSTSGHPVLLRTEMAGHGGATGRWDKYAERAEIMAFLIDQIRRAAR